MHRGRPAFPLPVTPAGGATGGGGEGSRRPPGDSQGGEGKRAGEEWVRSAPFLPTLNNEAVREEEERARKGRRDSQRGRTSCRFVCKRWRARRNKLKRKSGLFSPAFGIVLVRPSESSREPTSSPLHLTPLRRHASPPAAASRSDHHGNPLPPPCPPRHSAQPPQSPSFLASPCPPPHPPRRLDPSPPRHSVDPVPCGRRSGAFPGTWRRQRTGRAAANWRGAVARVPGVGRVSLRARALAAGVLPLGQLYSSDDRLDAHNAWYLTSMASSPLSIHCCLLSPSSELKLRTGCIGY
jgi:hypothetical protein